MVGDFRQVCSLFLSVEDALWRELSDIADDEGLSLYDVEKISPRSVRVFVAGREQASAVTSADCTRLCRRLMTLFLAEGPRFGLQPDAEIEVSSPGVNRNLRLREHFQRAVGERVRVKARGHANGEAKSSRLVIGELRLVDNDGFEVDDEATRERIQVPFADLKEARVDFKFS